MIHSVKISDLKPGTTYRYRVYSQEILDHQGVEVIYGRIAATDVWSKKPLCFTTNDRDKKEISFTVLNDIHGRTNDISELLNAVNYEEMIWLFIMEIWFLNPRVKSKYLIAL